MTPECVPARDIILVRPPGSKDPLTILVVMPPTSSEKTLIDPPYVVGTFSGQLGIQLLDEVVQVLEEAGYGRGWLVNDLHAFDYTRSGDDYALYQADPIY